MKKRSFSIKNKILIVLATLPIITVVAVVVMSTQSFTEDKLSYVYGTALSEARAKSSSTSSQIGSYLQIIKAITVNYDPQKKKLTNNGRTFFQGETSLKGFFSFRWDGSQFKSVFEQTKKTNLDEEERKHLQPLLQEAWHSQMALHPSKNLPMHIFVAVKVETAKGSEISVVLVESPNLFSLFQKNSRDKSFLFHRKRGLLIGEQPIVGLTDYLTKNVFNKEASEKTDETRFGELDYLTSHSTVGAADLVVVSVIDKKSALEAVSQLIENSVAVTTILLTICLIIGVFAANGLTRTLRNLAEATSKVMEGDFSVRVKAESKDEIGDLAESFNKMTEEVSRLMLKTAENARMEAELKTAQTVQETLFPENHAALGPVFIYGQSEPASECGGDWWHYSQVGDRVFVWIGDATGHGASAALITSAARAAASVIEATGDITPAQAMTILNRAIHATSKGQMMMTFFIGCFDYSKNTFTYSNASHDPPFYLNKEIEGKPKRKDYFPLMEVNNPRLGEKSDTVFKEYEMKIERGDKFIFYTDGILDVKNDKDEIWGERRF